VLDGAKTGKTLLQDKYSQDRNNETYGTRYTPPWKEIDRDLHSAVGQSSSIPLSRQSLPPFVMDVLCEAAERAKDICLKQIEERFNSLPKVKDLDLIAPWQDAEAHAQVMLSSSEQNVRIVGEAHKSAMDAIKAHVARVYDLSGKLISSMKKNAGARASTGGVVGVDVVGVGTSRAGGKSKGSKRRGGADFSQRSIEIRQDCLRRVSREFVDGPPTAETFVFSQEEVARLRASYAYLYDWMKHGGGERFPWNVAFDELGEIKLRAQKDFKPISRDFYEKMSIRKF
jgi:RNA-dependent RNA polymerase